MGSETPPVLNFDSPHIITDEERHHFQNQGFVRLKNVFRPDELVPALRDSIAQELSRADKTPLEADESYAKAFTQVMNLWVRNGDVRRFVFGKRLACIAADLMQVGGVRIYHDQALCKEPGGGPTPWHADQYYWPVSSDKMVTAWVPLQAVPVEMGPLEFAARSQQHDLGRHLSISADNERVIQGRLLVGGFETVGGPFALGEVSFHAGWTFHRANANQGIQPRHVFTIIYMDKDMRLVEPENADQRADVERWLPGVGVGGVCASPHNPLIYSAA